MLLDEGSSLGILPKQREQVVNHHISLQDSCQHFQAQDGRSYQRFHMMGMPSNRKVANFPPRSVV